jgi:hypothetical protein
MRLGDKTNKQNISPHKRDFNDKTNKPEILIISSDVIKSQRQTPELE